MESETITQRKATNAIAREIFESRMLDMGVKILVHPPMRGGNYIIKTKSKRKLEFRVRGNENADGVILIAAAKEWFETGNVPDYFFIVMNIKYSYPDIYIISSDSAEKHIKHLDGESGTQLLNMDTIVQLSANDTNKYVAEME